MAVHISNSSSYRGSYQTYGGYGFAESGGSGTAYIQAPDISGSPESTLIVDNRNSAPNNIYITDIMADSCRTYILTYDTDTPDLLVLDHVYVQGDAHLAFREVSGNDIDIVIGKLHGDLTGLIHSSTKHKISILESDRPIPTSFRSYDGTVLHLPPGISLFFNSLPNNKILDLYKLKALADDSLSVALVVRYAFDRVDKTL